MSKETAQDIENNTAGNIYKMGMDIIMEKPASAIVAGGTDLDKLLTQLERKYGKDNIQYAYGDHNKVTDLASEHKTERSDRELAKKNIERKQ